MEIENLEISKIKPYPKNAKKHPKSQIEKIANSIKKFGFNQPIILDKNNEIVVGHGRYEAARLLKMDHVPVQYVDNLSTEEVRAYRLADNKLNESEWDMALAIDELRGLSDDMIDLTDWDRDLLIEPDEKDDLIPDTAPARCKRGDLWQPGRHRLLCGDSTRREDVERLMDGKKADMVFTDPPYGINVVKSDGKIGGNRKGFKNYNGKANTKIYRKIEGDDKPFDPTFLLSLSEKIIIWGANNFSSRLPDCGRWLVWDKKNDIQLKNDFSDCELAWTNFFKYKSVKKYIHIWIGMTRAGNRKTELKTRLHPTQKPVGLFAEILGDYSQKNDIILDPFCGSGSTLIAAEKTGRICYGMEIDEHYCDVIIQRYEQFSGNTAKKVTEN